MPQPMTAAEFERADRHLIVRLSGELDQDTVPELTHTILGGIAPDDRDITLDLGAVTFCDSTGLAMLIRTQQHAHEQSTRLVLRNPSPILKATFAVCGLTDLLPIASDQ